MMGKFRFLYGLSLFSVIIVCGLGGVRLLSWDTLNSFDRFFFSATVVLFVLGLIVSFVFRNFEFDSTPSPSSPDFNPIVDSELLELRKSRAEAEANNKPIFVESPIVREPVDVPDPEHFATDISMYERKVAVPDRNIIKPPLQQDYNRKDDNEYSGVF
jgi:hypothetical protein